MWSWIIAGAILLAVVASLFAMKSNYDDGKRDDGRAEVTAKLQPQIDQLTRERDSHKQNLDEALHVNVGLVDAAKGVAKLAAERTQECTAATEATLAAQAETRRIRAANAELTKSHTARIVELVRRVNTPTVAGENVCAEAAAIGLTTMRDRQRLRGGK